jgi:hypothetical protein
MSGKTRYVLLVYFADDIENSGPDWSQVPYWALVHPYLSDEDTEYFYEDDCGEDGDGLGLTEALCATYAVEYTFKERETALSYLQKMLDKRRKCYYQQDILDFWLAPVACDERGNCTVIGTDDEGVARTFNDGEFRLMTRGDNGWEINFIPIAVVF